MVQTLETIKRPPPKGSWYRNIIEAENAERIIKSLSDEACNLLVSEWLFQARQAQWEPEGDWELWFVLAGRGFGKTRTGAEWVKRNALEKGVRRQIGVAPTSSDIRKTMVEGPSGLQVVWPQGVYKSQMGRFIFKEDHYIDLFSAEEPERLRGPGTERVWCDELAAWKRMQATWDNLEFTIREGNDPKILVTSTPKPLPLIKSLLKDPGTVITGGSMYENQANLADAFIRRMKRKYEGTRLGRQEIRAEILEDVEGALWNREMIDYADPVECVRVVVAIDVATTSGPSSDDTGIVVAGKGVDGLGYLKRDSTCHVSPNEWATRAVNLYHEHKADLIVAEANNGGDLIEAVIRTVDKYVPFKKVHASRGKRTRAEPISTLYEQGRIKHEKHFDALEDELCNWVPDSGMDSPNRLDAAVWAFTELMLNEREFGIA